MLLSVSETSCRELQTAALQPRLLQLFRNQTVTEHSVRLCCQESDLLASMVLFQYMLSRMHLLFDLSSNISYIVVWCVRKTMNAIGMMGMKTSIIRLAPRCPHCDCFMPQPSQHLLSPYEGVLRALVDLCEIPAVQPGTGYSCRCNGALLGGLMRPELRIGGIRNWGRSRFAICCPRRPAEHGKPAGTQTGNSKQVALLNTRRSGRSVYAWDQRLSHGPVGFPTAGNGHRGVRKCPLCPLACVLYVAILPASCLVCLY